MNLFNKYEVAYGWLRLAFFVLSCGCFISSARADIDWGGGFTQFYGEDGQALTSETGCATLIAVSAGELIDFRSFIPEHPSDLVRVGAQLCEGENLNRVIAETCFFFSGYLLYSAIPDLTLSELSDLGVSGGELLYLVVWDRTTFVDGAPTDRSYYTVQPLYEEGVEDDPLMVLLESSTVFAQLAHPVNALGQDQTLLAAEFAGHNTFSDFIEWAQAAFDLDSEVDVESARLMDTDQDGRSNFEEYAFRVQPSLLASTSLAAEASSTSGLAADLIDASSVAASPLFYAELRANDANLSYTAHAAGKLGEWRAATLSFEEGRWISSEEDLVITSASYAGEGIWTVAMQYQAPSLNGSCFYKMSVDELAQ
jgi:hypothetical protein